MKFQLGPITVTHLIATNFELICKTIALLFDEKLEKFHEVSTWPNNCNRFDWNEFGAEKGSL